MLEYNRPTQKRRCQTLINYSCYSNWTVQLFQFCRWRGYHEDHKKLFRFSRGETWLFPVLRQKKSNFKVFFPTVDEINKMKNIQADREWNARRIIIKNIQTDRTAVDMAAVLHIALGSCMI